MAKKQIISIIGRDAYGNQCVETVECFVPTKLETAINRCKWLLKTPYRLYCLKRYGFYKFSSSKRNLKY